MEDFINRLLQAQGISEDLDPEVRQQLVRDLMTRANDLINRRLIESLSSEGIAAFNQMIDQPDVTQDTVQSFIAQNVPNKEEIVQKALIEFRDLYLGDNNPGNKE